ncbi:MAG: CopD family protein [Ilumatobacteraceae bacterium]
MRLIRQLIATAVVALVAITLLAVSPAAAHTGFDSSDPADGSTIDGPPEAITLVFTGPAEPTGTGFEILDGSGALRTPSDASTADGSTWVLRFDPPLDGGQVGVRWMVKAPDAHPIDGSFSFTVTVPSPEPTTSVPAPPSVAEAADEPVEDAIAAQNVAGSEAGAEVVEPLARDSTAATDLDAFLDAGEPSSTPARVGAAARAMTLAGTLLGVGALVFAALVLHGERRDIRHVLFWVRRAGLLILIGVVAELAAQIAVEAGGDWAALRSPTAIGNVSGSVFGVAVGLRLTGGLAMAVGPRFDLAPVSASERPAVRDLVGVGARRVHGSPSPGHGVPPAGPRAEGPRHVAGDHVWQPGTSTVAIVGAIAVVAAHLFDGHTVVKGHRFWTGLVDVVHVVAGAVWVGGVVMLAVVLWRRHRHGRRLQALQLALRFSVVATIALVAVAVAGLALTVIVLDSPSGLWSTQWGRTLLVKTVLVVLAAAGGAYNHRVLIPQLSAAPDDPTLAARFRTVVTFEAVALAAVVAATALLMGAAS